MAKKFTKIDNFHIDHNANCLPPKLCVSIMFDFSWDDPNTQEKMETMVMQNFGGLTRCMIVNVKMVNTTNIQEVSKINWSTIQ